jgi:hypothetical protein
MASVWVAAFQISVRVLMRPRRLTHICIPAAMMREMARTHNSMVVKRGYLIFIIIIFLMPHDRNFIRYSSSTVTVWSVALMYSPISGLSCGTRSS